MDQVLSQQEIDALLNALNTGELDPDSIKEEEEKDKIKPYDFRRPIKLSKEYVNTLHMIFENFSKITGNVLSSKLRANVNITVGAIEQVSYDEFIRSISRSTLMGIFSTNELSGTQIVEINPHLCTQIVELMCGGSESKDAAYELGKEKFTDIELSILEEILENVLNSFESAWSEVIDLKTEIESIDTNPQMVQNMSPNEPVVLISFLVEIFKNKSFMNICIPYVSFEHILDKLSFKNWFDFEKETGSNDRKSIESNLMNAMVDLEVSLGRSIITIEDFLQLELGDIIQLDMKTTDPLKLYIEDQLHYLVKPGVVNKKLAVEILQFIEEEGE